MNSPKSLPQKLVPWAEARRRHRLSHAHVQMARELGLNPKKLGKLENHNQEPWKAPLPDFIARIYWKRFGRERPLEVLSLEEIAARQQAKKAARRERKMASGAKREAGADNSSAPPPGAEDDTVEGGRPIPDGDGGPPWF